MDLQFDQVGDYALVSTATREEVVPAAMRAPQESGSYSDIHYPFPSIPEVAIWLVYLCFTFAGGSAISTSNSKI